MSWLTTSYNMIGTVTDATKAGNMVDRDSVRAGVATTAPSVFTRTVACR